MILPRLREFEPEIIVISAGFDAHTRDPLANLNLVEDDFAWVTQKLMEIADKSAQGRIVSLLEGGYDLAGPGALGRGACHRADARLDNPRYPHRQRSGFATNRGTTMAETGNADVKKLPFERAIDELESIVKRLEEGKVPLEESVAIYERGEALKKRCEELLRQAEARVEKITLDSSGKPTGSEPLDVD